MDPHDADKQESTHSSSGFRNQSESTRNGDILRRMPPVSASTVTSFDGEYCVLYKKEDSQIQTAVPGDSGPSSLDGKEYSAGEVKFMYKDKKLAVSANILINCDEEKRRYTQQLSIPLDASFDKSEEAVGVHVAKAFAQTMQGMSHALQNQVQPKPISHKGYLTDRIVPIHTGRYEDEFEEMGSIGKGGFATVTKAKHRIDEQCYAIKRIPLKTSKDMGQEKEATILARLTKESLNCDSIVRYHNAWLEEVWKRPRQSSGGCSTSVRQIEASSSFSDSSSEDEFSQSKSTRLKSLEWKNSSKEESSHSIVFKDSSKRNETVIHSNTSSSKTKSTKFELLNETPLNGIYTSFSSSEKFQYRETREILSNSTSRKKERSKKLWIKQNNNYEEQQLRGMKPLTRMVLYIQMELCGKTLSDWLTERNAYKESEDCFSRVECTTNTHIIRQILEGLRFIHRHDILHRDLKPLNVFLSEPHLNVKIGDFGLAREVIMESETLASGPGRGLNGQPQLSSEVGTTLYTAPEQKKGGSYDHKADMFSLGIISYELFHPFRTGHERINCITKLKEGVLPEEIEERWAKEAEMIKNLTSEEKGRRPSADDLLRNDLFQVDGAIKEEKLRHLEETNKKQEMEIKRTSSMYELKEKELKQENQELMERNRALEERLKEKQKELQQERVQRDEEMGKIKKEMKQKIQQMRKKEQDLRKKDQEMKRKDEELVELRKEVRRMRVSSDSSCRDSVSSVDIDDSLEE